MIQVRKGVFETNSSSTHTIALDTSDIDVNSIAKEVHFGIGSFNWEFSSDNSTADYLWTAILYFLNDRDHSITVNKHKLKLDDIISLIHDAFAKYGVKTSFDIIVDASIYMGRSRDIGGNYYKYPALDFRMSFASNGSIDHCDELSDFVIFMLSDPDNIVKFVLNKNSIVITGNDNEDTPDDIQEVIDTLNKDKSLKVFGKRN